MSDEVRNENGLRLGRATLRELNTFRWRLGWSPRWFTQIATFTASTSLDRDFVRGVVLVRAQPEVPR
jgi:predicted dithiol-disulfide oxidoreductase (DUF899 family)